MSIRAKFRCNNVDVQGESEAVSLSAVTDDSPENKSWSEATPSGLFDIRITNPAAQGQFERGEEYYIDVTPVKEPPKAEEPADVTA